MNSKMILILVIAIFFSGALVPAFADTTGSCGIEKKDIIKSVIAYITQKSDINRGQVMVLIRGYLGSLDCGNSDLAEAQAKADTITEDIVPKCSDGTLFAHCSYDKPKYCYSGKLVDRCDLCCDSGRCTSDGQCENELNIIDCEQAYGSGFFCGTYSDWEGQCQSSGQINELADQKCSDSIDATQYCIKCEPQDNIINCAQQYGDEYWCSTYDEWKIECNGSGQAIELTNAKCYKVGGIFNDYCSKCAPEEPSCHVHTNPSWLETNDYDIQVIEKGCTDSFGTEHLVEIREKVTPTGIEHCGERIWVWLEHGLNPLESGKCYRVMINTDTVSGHVITGVGDEKSCPVCENTTCHTHTNPTWIDDGVHKIKIVGIGCTQAGCAEGDYNGTEVLIELREGAFCGEQVWVWLDTMMSPNAPDIGSCYMAEIFTEMYGSDCGHVIRYLFSSTDCPDCEGNVSGYGDRCAEDAECSPPLVCQTSGRYDESSVYTEEYCCHADECASVINGPCVKIGGTDIKEVPVPNTVLTCVFNNYTQRADYVVDCDGTYGAGYFCGTLNDWQGQCNSTGDIQNLKSLSGMTCSLDIPDAYNCIRCA